MGQGFKGLISYLETGRGGRDRRVDRVEWVEFRNLPTRDPEVAACMMAATADASVSNTRTPVYHFSISCDPDDPVDGNALRRVADRIVRDLGLQEYEVLVFSHKDRSHPHLHFVVNRVHPVRGTLWSPWRDYYRIERTLRAQEVELGLRVVPGWLAPTPRREQAREGTVAPLHPSETWRLQPRPASRRGDSAFRTGLTERAVPVMERAHSWAELERGLAECGLSLRVKGGGFRLTDGRSDVKASEVGREFSRKNLEKRLGPYPDYRARMAVADVAPAPARALELETRAQQQESTPPPTATSASAGLRVGAAAAPEATAPEPVVESALQPSVQAPRAQAAEPPAPVSVASPTPPQRREIDFRSHVQDRAVTVLQRASSWEELVRRLADHGLSLRAKGGGFVVTDGEWEVKASVLGRALSRFHLEKRLGQYPGSRARAAVDDAGNGINEPLRHAQAPEGERPGAVVERGPASQPAVVEPPAPPLATSAGASVPIDAAAAIDVAAPEPVKEPIQEPAAQPPVQVPWMLPIEPRVLVPMEPPAPTQRRLVTFLQEVKDRVGLVLERADSWEALKRGLADHGLSLRVKGGGFMVTDGDLEVKASDVGRAFSRFHLERRLGRYPDSRARGGVDYPAPAPPRPAVQKGEQARTEALSPAFPAGAPEDRAVPHPAEPVSVLSRPVEPPTPVQPTVQEVPRAPALPPAKTVEPAAPPARPAESVAPIRRPMRPATERERYRTVLGAFKAELAALYHDPRAARHAFTASLGEIGPEAAVRALDSTPDRFGRLRLGADLRRATEISYWAELYARAQLKGTRAAARRTAQLFRRAETIEEADSGLYAARSKAQHMSGAPNSVAALARKADEAERFVERWLPEIYKLPLDARVQIETYRNVFGREEMVRALRDSPECFGVLRSEKRWLPMLRDTTEAQRVAQVHAWSLGRAFDDIRARPERADYERAEEAVRAANQALDAAQSARDALGSRSASEWTRHAALTLQSAAWGSAERARRLDRQLSAMLSASAGYLARKAMQQLAQDQEREQGREHRRGGFDIM
jgi:hypothetical protein